MEWASFAPALLTLVAFVVIPAVLAVVAQMLFNRVVSHDRLIPHHDVAGFLVAVVGVLYAVVLGFVVVTSWSAFDSAQQNADVEAGDVGDAFGFAQMLPEPRREHMRRSLAAYAIEVRDHEWALLSHGMQDDRARELLVRAIGTLGEPYGRPSPNLDEALNRTTTRQTVAASLRDIADNRRLRIIEAQKTFSPALALVLIVGALMVLAFVFLFGVEDRVLQFTMTSIVAGCIGLLLGVVVEFSAPYSGAMRVSPQAWTYVIVNNHFEEVARSR
ncbi:MAG: hypothetical protein WCD38_09405 [Candidatus Tumulicola sp.]